MFSWFWIWFQFFSYIFMSTFNILATSSNQKRNLGNLFVTTARSAEITEVQATLRGAAFRKAHFVVSLSEYSLHWFLTKVSLFQSCKHQCAVSLHCSCTSLDRKAGSQLVRSQRSLSVNGWETSHPAGGKHFSFFAT